VIVNPVEGAADDLFRVVAKLVIDGDVGITGDLRSLGADLLEVPEVLGVHFGVGKMIERAQQHAAPGVKRNPAADVRMGADEFGDGANLGLGGRKRAGAELLVFLPPI
jgi:hypothetical protein